MLFKLQINKVYAEIMTYFFAIYYYVYDDDDADVDLYHCIKSYDELNLTSLTTNHPYIIFQLFSLSRFEP